MKTNFEKMSGSKIELEVTLEPKEFHDYWQTAYDQAVSQVQIKGFRPGAAPKDLADQAINKEKVFEVAAQQAIRLSLKEASEANNWIIIDQPKVEILEATPLSKADADKNAGLKYKAELITLPVVTLGNYKKIAQKVLADKKIVTVDPQEIIKTLDWLRQSRAKLSRVSRQAAKGDLIDVDIDTFNDHKPLTGGQIKNDRLVLGESRFVSGFDDQIVSHKESETLEFSLTTPTDYWQQELQNKKLDFKVKINAVFERQLPELDDQFAKGLGPNFAGIEQVKENIASGLKVEKEEKEQERLRAKMLDEIITASKIDPPQILIDKTLDGLLEETKQLIKSSSQKYTDEELKKSLKDRAVQRVLANLVIHEITKVEQLEPTPAEVEQEAKTKNLDLEQNYDYIYSIIRHKKLFQFLENTN